MIRVLCKLKGGTNKYWKDWAVIENYGDDDDDEDEELNDSGSDIE